MKEVIKEVLGYQDKSFQVPILEYSSVEEIDKDAGKQGACLETALRYLHFHGTFGDARELIVDIAHQLSKEPFKTKPVMKDGKPVVKDGKPVLARDTKADGDATYVERVIAAGKTTFDAIQAEINKRARGYKVTVDGKEVEVPALRTDVRKPEPKAPKAKVLSQKFKEVAITFLDGKKSLEKLNKAFAASGIAQFTAGPNRDENIEKLGWLCKAYQDAQDAFAKL